MSQDMSSTGGWRSLASSTIKSYVSRSAGGARGGEEGRQGWRQWAGDKLRGRAGGAQALPPTEVLHLFPSWAARRYAPHQNQSHGADPKPDPQPFTVEVTVSGYAITHKGAENASRSQRAFMRLAKSFAALPKLIDTPGDATPGSVISNDGGPNHIPRPSEIDDLDVAELERQLRHVKSASMGGVPTSTTSLPRADNGGAQSVSQPASPSRLSPPSSSEDLQKQEGRTPADSSSSTSPFPAALQGITSDVLRQMHANLEMRLQPFWSSVLPNRVIRIELFPTRHRDADDPSSTAGFAQPLQLPRTSSPEFNSVLEAMNIDTSHGPLVSQDVVTASDGSFSFKINIEWEQLCHHPPATHIVFGEEVQEHDIVVIARFVPLPTPVQQTPPSPSYEPYRPRHSPSQSAPLLPQVSPQPAPAPPLLLRIPITHSPLRVISDIDDTVKDSGVTFGAKAVFHNVFVKELRDAVIPGMGEWYRKMWDKGVRFHYVSNGPFEMLNILPEFFKLSSLPPGSIKLKSYAGRSLLSGFLSAPAAKKRGNLLELLDAFPESQFVLIGDSGEQDLELYTECARDRPNQIVAVYIRDVGRDYDSLDDPTGERVLRRLEAEAAAATAAALAEEQGNFNASPRSSFSSSRSSLRSRDGSDVEGGAGDVTARPGVSSFLAGDSTPRRSSSPFSRVVQGARRSSSPKPGSGQTHKHLKELMDKERVRSGRSRTLPPALPASGNANGVVAESGLLGSQTAGSSGSTPNPNPTPNPNLTPSPIPPFHPTEYTYTYPSIVRTSPVVNQAPGPIPPPSIMIQPQRSSSYPSAYNLQPYSSNPPPHAIPNATYGMAPMRHRNDSHSSLYSRTSEDARLEEAEKKRTDLQTRVWKAREALGRNPVVLRMFREPDECREVWDLIS